MSAPVVLLGVTGSIAAYKAADIVSGLVKTGVEVDVVMTPAATRFITPLTLGTLSRRPVSVDLWEEERGWQPGHIELADRAHLFVVAPATAHTLAKMTQGLADDLLGNIYLATRAPVLLAPAMNGKMLQHPATQANFARLRERGHRIIDPVEGMLACGYEGPGKLAPVETILAAIQAALAEIRQPASPAAPSLGESHG